MQAEYGALVRAGGEKWIPVARMDGRHIKGGWVLRECDSSTPFGRQTTDFMSGKLNVEQGEEAAWMNRSG